MSNPKTGSALANNEEIDGYISIEQLTDRGMIDLRGNAGDKKLRAAVKKVLKIELPTKPRTSTSKGEISVFWLSIDQWLVLCPLENTKALHSEIEVALEKVHSLAVNISDARVIIRLSGNGVREVLMKGSPVDLTAAELNAGTVRRLRFAEQAAMIHMVSENDDIVDLFVFRSYASYIWDWLAATSKNAAEIEIFCQQPTAEF